MHGNRFELFSDYFAQATNVFTGIDARVKLIFVLATLALNIFCKQIYVLLLISLLCICTLLLARLPLRMILARLAAPLFMAGIIIILQGLFFGKTPLYSLNYSGIGISLYREGISRGILIAGRVIAGMSLILFLSMTTTLNKLLGALKFFKVPDEWLEVTMFAYRYIFVFIEEVQSIMDAQRLRLGYNGLVTGLKSWGALVGSLFTRLYDQAHTTHDAMSLRGYNGTLHREEVEEHRTVDEPRPVTPVEEHRYVERRVVEPERSDLVAITAIRYVAIVVIVIAILYFLAVFLIPALTGR